MYRLVDLQHHKLFGVNFGAICLTGNNFWRLTLFGNTVSAPDEESTYQF